MNISEFFEFIARSAELFFTESLPLAKKVEKILMRLLPAVDCEYMTPNLEENLESESDYDDDWVDEFVQENLKAMAQVAGSSFETVTQASK